MAVTAQLRPTDHRLWHFDKVWQCATPKRDTRTPQQTDSLKLLVSAENNLGAHLLLLILFEPGCVHETLKESVSDSCYSINWTQLIMIQGSPHWSRKRLARLDQDTPVVDIVSGCVSRKSLHRRRCHPKCQLEEFAKSWFRSKILRSDVHCNAWPNIFRVCRLDLRQDVSDSLIIKTLRFFNKNDAPRAIGVEADQ